MGSGPFDFEVKFTRSKRSLSDLPKKIATKLSRAMRIYGLDFIRRIKTQSFGGRPNLQRRTGELSRSFNMEITGSALNDLTLRVFSRSPYAKIQEYGGTIRPKNAQWLAIPLDAAKTGAGVARGGPRDYQNTFFATSKKGNLILFQKDAGGGIIPLFVMKKEVTIPPRLGMRQLWHDTRLQRNMTLREALKG